jgi:hypothetical protein
MPWFPSREQLRRAGTQLIELGSRPVVILLIALTLRLGIALFLPPSPDFAALMEPGRTALNLASGRGYTFDFYGTRTERPLVAFLPPLHPWLLALSLQFADAPLAYSVFQALLGTLTVGLLYLLATEMAGRRVGVLAAWGAALYPPHLLLVGQPHSTVLHACCLVAVLLAGWRLCKQPTGGRALVTGSLVGIFALGRPQMMAFAPIIVGWLWLNQVRGRRLWRSTLVLVLAAVAVVLPWCIRNTLLFGRPTFLSTNGGVTFWNGNNPFTTGSAHDVYADKLAAYRGIERDRDLPDVYQHPEPYPFPPEIEARLGSMPELELDRAAYRAGLDYIRRFPLDWLELEGRKLVSFWWFRPNLGANPIYRDHWTALYKFQYPFLLIPAIVGIALSARSDATGPTASWRRYSLLYAILLFYTLIHLIYNVLTRYRWEIELLLVIFAAIALDEAWQKLAGRERMA